MSNHPWKPGDKLRTKGSGIVWEVVAITKAGWITVKPTDWSTANGQIVKPQTYSPKTIAKMFERAEA